MATDVELLTGLSNLFQYKPAFPDIAGRVQAKREGENLGLTQQVQKSDAGAGLRCTYTKAGTAVTATKLSWHVCLDVTPDITVL